LFILFFFLCPAGLPRQASEINFFTGFEAVNAYEQHRLFIQGAVVIKNVDAVKAMPDAIS